MFNQTLQDRNSTRYTKSLSAFKQDLKKILSVQLNVKIVRTKGFIKWALRKIARSYELKGIKVYRDRCSHL